MSVDAVKWSIKQKTGDVTAKSVLRMLAWHHNPETGLCCPSIPLLQEECDIKSDNTVKAALKRLVAAGLIASEREMVNGAIKRTRYTLIGFDPSNIAGGANIAPGEGQILPLPSLKDCPSVPQILPPKEKIEGEENKEEVRATQIFSAEKIARPEQDLAEEINSQLRDAVDRDPDDFDPADATPEALDIFDTEPLSVGGTKAAPCPVTEIVALYNKKLGPYLRTVRKMTPARAQAVRARWRDVAEIVESQDRATVMEGMSDYFDKIARSNFLMGRVPGKAWRADFDFIFSQRGFTRIFEDKYANG